MERELRPESGFTLIELLVVVAILATLAAGISLSVSRSGTGAEGDLARFRQIHDQQRSLAIHGLQTRGLRVTSRGLQILHRSGAGAEWEPAGPMQPWRGRVSWLAQGPQGASGENSPNLIFLPNGQTSGFVLRFDRQDCRSDGWTGLICDAS